MTARAQTVRRAPAKKATAAVAARREVRAEKTGAKPLAVTFRGQTFDIPVDRLGAYFMRGQYMAEFGVDAEQISKSMFRLLGQRDSARFLDLMVEGDGIYDVVVEFSKALNKAANVPNS